MEEAFEEWKLNPSKEDATLLILALGRMRTKLALEVYCTLRDMNQEPDSRAFTALLLIMIHGRQFTDVLQLVDDAYQYRLELDSLAMHNLALACTETQDKERTDKVQELYKLHFAKLAPQEPTAGELCKAYVTMKDLRSGLELLRWLLEQDVSLSGSVYTTLLKGCREERNLKYGRAVHTAWADLGQVMDDKLINSLLHMYFTCGDPSTAFQLAEQHEHLLDENEQRGWRTVFNACHYGPIPESVRPMLARKIAKDPAFRHLLPQGVNLSDLSQEI